MTNLYRYYKGETECPFDRKDAEGDMLSTFWHIEHQYANAMTEDTSFQNRWEMETQEYIQRCKTKRANIMKLQTSADPCACAHYATM